MVYIYIRGGVGTLQECSNTKGEHLHVVGVRRRVGMSFAKLRLVLHLWEPSSEEAEAGGY